MNTQSEEKVMADRYFLLEQILSSNDLSKLTLETRVKYYDEVCANSGLNPLTKPFEFIVLNGKLTLYARREATDQLRRIHNISISITARDIINDIYVVTARATMPNGRFDESTGAVSMTFPAKYKDKEGKWHPHPSAGKPLDGEDRANAILKSETKSKRRVTLSIVGLGLLDESEIEDIPIETLPTATQVPVVEGLTRKVPEQTPAAQETGRKDEPAVTGNQTASPAAVGEPKTVATQAETSNSPSVTGNPAGSAPATVTETGELMPANRIKVMKAKMQVAGITDEVFTKKFGKPIEQLLKSQSAEIQSFIENPK